MKIKVGSRFFSITQVVCLAVYYSFAQFLPCSYSPFGGKIAQKVRRYLCVRIFKYSGRKINVERKANFGSGLDIQIGDYSDLGINCHVPSNTIIGNNVMMAPGCFIFSQNHATSDVSIPMNRQGFTEKKITIIEDDVWIGQNVYITPGRHIKKGTIIGACCLLCKDFPEYSVVGGNPSKLIKSRLS